MWLCAGDFGLARGTKEEADYELTEYVVTRWYRAPEVMCSCQEYDHKIDVWSVGCILAELHGRKPLFPGDDYIKQMNLIFGVLGTPSKDDMKFITNEKALEYIKSLKKKPKITFDKIYRVSTSTTRYSRTVVAACVTYRRVSMVGGSLTPFVYFVALRYRVGS